MIKDSNMFIGQSSNESKKLQIKQILPGHYFLMYASNTHGDSQDRRIIIDLNQSNFLPRIHLKFGTVTNCREKPLVFAYVEEELMRPKKPKWRNWRVKAEDIERGQLSAI